MRMFNYERLSDDIKIAVSSDHTFGTDAVILSDFAKIKPRDKALDVEQAVELFLFYGSEMKK